MGYSFSMKKIFYLVFFSSFFVIALSTFSSKALAGSCTISSGNTEDYEGLIVHVAVLDKNGNMNSTPANTGYTMNLTSNANGGTGGDAGIIRVNSSKAVIEGPYAGVQFSPVTSGCTDTGRVDSYNAGDMVLDYGTSSQNVSGIPSSPSNSSGWVLMCGTSTNPGSKNGDGRSFTMSMNGHPAGYADGGTWLYYFDGDTIPHAGSLAWNLADKSHGAINGLTMQFNAVYVEPSPPPTSIQGAVYSKSGAAVDNVQITGVSVPAGLKTGSPHAGWFNFDLPIGTGFSIHAQDPFTSANGHKHSGVKITPFNGSVDISGYICKGNSSSYEEQVADESNSNAGCRYVPPKQAGNGGYDFHYTKEQYAVIAVAGTVAPSGAYPGTTVNFTGSATVSQTLPDDGNDTYKIAITPVPPNVGDTTFSGSTCSASSTTKLLAATPTVILPCSITIPATSTPGTRYCVTTSVTSYPSYATVSGNNPKKCVNVLAPPTISLGAVPSHEIGSNSSANISYTINCKDFLGTLTYNVSVLPAVPNSLASTTYSCTTVNATYNGTIANTASFLDGVTPNKYVYTAQITAAAQNPGEPALPPVSLPITSGTATLNVYTVPYARFYGGDIMSQGSGGQILFNTKTNSLGATASTTADTSGSATQYAVVAKNVVMIASASFSTNKNSLTAKIYASPNIASTQSTGGGTWNSTTNDWSASGYYGNVNANSTIGSATNVNKKITVVGKDIFIVGDVTVDTTNLPSPYGTAAAFDDSLTPSLVFISKGNIYISSSVTRIDASLQAQGGSIYTCWDANKITPGIDQGTNCQKTLTVNGSVGASKSGSVPGSGSIHFNRSCGTRLNAALNEDSGLVNGGLLSARTCTSFASGVAAEVFNFPNYLYFTSSYGSGSASTQFQSLYSAPPLL